MANQKRASQSTTLGAYPVLPSNEFQGNDGKWSTFIVNAGSPPQQFYALISTSGLGAWLVDDTACNVAQDSTVSQHPDCQTLRGSQHNTGWSKGNSSTYQQLGDYVLELNNDIPLATAFGSSPVSVNYTGAEYNNSASLGRDRVGLLSNDQNGSPITANGSLVYGMVDQSFWISTLGIGNGNQQLEQNPAEFPSFLNLLANGSVIPSKSWGYTAGAYYSKYRSHAKSFKELMI
jgi:hypothetical protein